jgi:lysophospholipase L1-like esterase
MTKDTSYRFLALGDSYTVGEGVDYRECWPIQLQKRAKSRKIFLEKPEIIAKTGWTTDELIEGIKLASPGGPYDCVSLLIGVNNQYRSKSTQEYKKEFKNLLVNAIAFAGNKPKHVFVLSIPDWGITPFGKASGRPNISEEIDQFNAINLQETQAAGANYIDITPISKKAAEDVSLLASDGLHPSAKMYEEWVKLFFPKFLNELINKE